jgi:hypothetical protein
LAPPTVVFVDSKWKLLGYKGAMEDTMHDQIRDNLDQMIANITKIPQQVLHNYTKYHELRSIEDKLRWMNGRAPTLEGDPSHALFGIFDVSLPALYGERGPRVKQRPREALYQ